jgi:thiamine transporter ThiT
VSTALSVVSFSSNGKKAVFNSVHWTVLWTILLVYSIHVSTFAVFFGQFFKRGKASCLSSNDTMIFYSIAVLLAKLLGAVLWIVTFIDFYGNVPVGVRYLLCLFPNTGLLFCIQVMQQYERRSGAC